jgi:hypothetical protein
MMTTRTILMLIGGAIVLLIITALSIALIIQSSRLDKAKTEIQKKAYDKQKTYIEKEYIPAALDKLTTTEKSEMGSVLWGEE